MISESPIYKTGFLVLEGVNGAGKSSLQEGLAAWLREKGQEVLCTREPGGTELGKKLRHLLLEQTERLDPVAELLLFSADRAEHVAKTIIPALRGSHSKVGPKKVVQNGIVICDRFFYSTMAFQGYGRGLALETIEKVSSVAAAGLVPDAVILLDCDPSVGLLRNQKRPERDGFEAMDMDFHARVREGFLHLAKNRPENFVVLDASKRKEDVLALAKNALKAWAAAIKCRD